MQPRFNSFPSHFPNQSNTSNPPFQSQGFSANPPLPDLSNGLPSSMPIQPQMGTFNPQIPLPFNNPSFPMPNMAALIAQQPALVNQLAMALQNQSNNMNTIAMLMNQLNSCQPQGQGQGQPFAANFPQQVNPNMGYANFPNMMQNPNPLMSTPLLNPSQFVAPQRPNFFPNPPFVAGEQEANANQKNFAEEKRINQMPRYSAPFRNQGQPVNSGHNSSSTSNFNNFPRNDFRKNMKYEKSPFPHNNNGKRKFVSSDEHRGTVSSGFERAPKSGNTNFTEQAGERKRSFALTYTEQEIKLWREERKKNHPSNANAKTNHDKAKANSGVNDEEAKLRRERLKEILAKQAELGVEVAEIPPHYLIDSAKQVKDNEDNRSTYGKKGKFGKKHEKHGRRKKRDRFGKKRTPGNNKDPSTISCFEKREQTLLQKLLSADVKRDKQHLLQVFRFFVANNFFKEFPDKPLEFPQIVVKESQESQPSGKKSTDLQLNRIVKEEEEEGEIIN